MTHLWQRSPSSGGSLQERTSATAEPDPAAAAAALHPHSEALPWAFTSQPCALSPLFVVSLSERAAAHAATEWEPLRCVCGLIDISTGFSV